MKNFLRRAGLGMLMAAGVVVLAGCGDKARPYHLLLECDEVVAKNSVRVDLVPVSQFELQDMEGYSVSKWWDPQDRKRASMADKITKNFGIGQPRSYLIKTSDPEIKAKWRDWLNRRVTHVIVLADLPGVTQDLPGNADPRRKIIPLNKKSLPDTSAIRVLIQAGGVRIDPLEKLPKT